jgi:hypothetical protein
VEAGCLEGVERQAEESAVKVFGQYAFFGRLQQEDY